MDSTTALGLIMMAGLLLLFVCLAIAILGNGGVRMDRRQGGPIVDARKRDGVVRLVPEDAHAKYIDVNSRWFNGGGL